MKIYILFQLRWMGFTHSGEIWILFFMFYSKIGQNAPKQRSTFESKFERRGSYAPAVF